MTIFRVATEGLCPLVSRSLHNSPEVFSMAITLDKLALAQAYAFAVALRSFLAQGTGLEAGTNTYNLFSTSIEHSYIHLHRT